MPSPPKFPDDYPYRRVWIGSSRVLLEEEPRHRLYTFLGEDFYLPLPYVQYLVGVGHSASHGIRGTPFREGGRNSFKIHTVGCTTEPISSDEQRLNHLPLPNISPGNSPCYNFVGYTTRREEMAAGIGEAINGFWWQNGNFDYFPWDDVFIRALMTDHEMTLWETSSGSAPRVRRKIALNIFKRWQKLSFPKLMNMPFDRLPDYYAMTPRSITKSTAAKVVRT